MSQKDNELEFMERIIRLEERLTNTIGKLDNLISTVEKNYIALNRIHQGDGNVPSLVSRILTLEDFYKTVRWTVGLLYAAVITIIVKLIADKI